MLAILLQCQPAPALGVVPWPGAADGLAKVEASSTSSLTLPSAFAPETGQAYAAPSFALPNLADRLRAKLFANRNDGRNPLSPAEPAKAFGSLDLPDQMIVAVSAQNLFANRLGPDPAASLVATESPRFPMGLGPRTPDAPGWDFALPRTARFPGGTSATQPGLRNERGAGQSIMPMGQLTEAPLGFRDMCARDQQACAPAAAPRVATPLTEDASLRLLKRVNRRVNHRIVWQPDYGDDHWTRPDPVRPHGDCEDFAIEKRDELLAAGFPAEDLYFAVGYLPRMGLHAVLVARTSKGDMLLDSLNERLVPWNKSPYIWVLRQVVATSPQWSTVPILNHRGA